LKHEGEDADLNFRLRKAGFKLLYIPQSYVFHRYRATPGKWWKNMYRYGRARARLMIRDPTMVNVLYIAPIVFVLIMTATTLSIFTPFFLIPLVYFPVIFIMSLLVCFRKKRVGLTFRVMLAYLLTHFGYGLGQISVLLKTLLGWKILRAGGPNR
jgi:GT2 family glycosyltransferase